MWFVKSLPTEIDWNCTIKSLPNGYQRTEITFKFEGPSEGDSTDYVIVFPYPWAGNKPNGSFELVCNSTNNKMIQITDVKYHGFIKELREAGYNIMTTSDIKNTYTSDSNMDFGYVSVKALPGVWHRIEYKHKISSQSCLFASATLPFVLKSKNIPVRYQLTTIGGLLYRAPKFLKHLETFELCSDITTGMSKCSISHSNTTPPSEVAHAFEIDPSNLNSFTQDIYIRTMNWDTSDEDCDGTECDEGSGSNRP